MVELVLLLALAAALVGVAGHAFTRPKGVYWRSAAGVALTAVAAGLVWLVASPLISNESGFGALVVWLMAVALAALIAGAACLAATARHIVDAVRSR